MLYLCCAVYKRYDCLVEMINSAMSGTLKPDEILIIDNGQKLDVSTIKHKVKVYRPPYNLGLATAWNHFLSHTEDVRLMVNDDVIFYPNTIKNLVDSFDENKVIFPVGVNQINSFSCMIIPENVFRVVGPFDINISPHYAYFEDNDYSYRMKKYGIDLFGVPNCDVKHVNSATLKAYTNDEMVEHHKKFSKARDNFVRKWGGMPGKEKYANPYNSDSYIYREDIR